jgi:hypothetical protein
MDSRFFKKDVKIEDVLLGKGGFRGREANRRQI